MSTLIAANANGVVVLATDSRTTTYYKDTKQLVYRDDTEKIFELAPGVFYAASGWNLFLEAALNIAVPLARTADLTGPQGFANELDRAWRPLMDEAIAQITAASACDDAAPWVEEQATGVMPFYTYALAFVSDRLPGYIVHEFRIKNGKPVLSESCQFKLPARSIVCYATGGPLVEHLSKNPKTWADGPVRAVEKLVDGVHSAHPAVGGPTQMVRIDRRGARWIHRLTNPQTINNASEVFANAIMLNSSEILLQGVGTPFVSITASEVAIVQGSLSVTSGSETFSAGPAVSTPIGTIVGAQIEDTANALVFASSALVACTSAGHSANYATVSSGGFFASTGIGGDNVLLTPTQIQMTGLPSSNPGSGSKQVWYDPSDSNRMKFQP
jgi:hypothetical protein